MTRHFDTRTVQISTKKKGGVASKTTPIYQTSVFSFEDLDDMESFYHGEKDYLYTRVGNPNTDELGTAVANIEGAPAGVAASSGTSAILAGILSVAKQGDHVLAALDIYGGTYQLMASELQSFGIEVTFVKMENKEEIEKYIKKNTKMIYSESVANPLLRTESIEDLAVTAKKHGSVLMIDNTFATPYLCRPYEQGADLVVHSATKYLGGHSDVTAGVLAGREELIAEARTKIVNLGTNLSPFEAWLTCRGIKTLSVRMERHCRNAAFLAEELKKHPAVQTVYYPDFVSDKGNGAIVTIDITGKGNIKTFFKSLGWIKIVPTLAGVETSVSYPMGTSHRALPKESLEELHITEGLIRISVGIENQEDIAQAFHAALDKAKLAE